MSSCLTDFLPLSHDQVRGAGLDGPSMDVLERWVKEAMLAGQASGAILA